MGRGVLGCSVPTALHNTATTQLLSGYKAVAISDHLSGYNAVAISDHLCACSWSHKPPAQAPHPL